MNEPGDVTGTMNEVACKEPGTVCGEMLPLLLVTFFLALGDTGAAMNVEILRRSHRI